MWLFEGVRAAAHIALGKFEEAERLSRSAIRRPGAAFWAYASLASVLGSLGRIEEARPALDKLLDLNPDFSPEWVKLVFLR